MEPILQDLRWPRSIIGLAKYQFIQMFLMHLILLSLMPVQPSVAILNCFPGQSMFKMNKGGQVAYNGPERANWYPSPYLPHQMSGYPVNADYGNYSPKPMKLLFQPKWRGGGLFGNKGWGSWKMGTNSNFYRPNYGYQYPMSMMSSPLTAGGYATSDTGSVIGLQQNPISYNNPNLNDVTWSTPITSNLASPIQQVQLNGYDTFSPSPPRQQMSSTIIDPYSGTKGSTSGKYTSIPSKNSVLQATSGYGIYDLPRVPARNQSYGYTYPDWYSGAVESPAKIAQQLMKYGTKSMRSNNKSASLIQESRFAILDEPRFVGFGTVDLLTNREAKLSCSFNEAIDQFNRPLWVKYLGRHNLTREVDRKIVPAFNCESNLCRTQDVESTKDYRYKFDNGPATSTLIITDPRLSDYGIYRCSALTKAINNNPLETIYQIIRFEA